MKVIIFGATGGTGTHLVNYLVDKGIEVAAVGRRPKPEVFEGKAEYYQVDISQEGDFAQLPDSGIDACVHLAAAMPSRMEGYSPKEYFRVNIDGTHNVLEYCRRSGIEKVVFTQTVRDISGHWADDPKVHADMPRRYSLIGDHAVYVISKNAAVDLVEHYHQQYGFSRYILRLPTIYMYEREPYFYVDGVRRMYAWWGLIEQAKRGETMEIWGDPKKGKDVVYVTDFCQIVYKALRHSGEGGTYNVGAGRMVSLEEQIRTMAQVFGGSIAPEIIVRSDRPDAREYLMDIEKTRHDLGYEPEYTDYRKMLEAIKAEKAADRE